MIPQSPDEALQEIDAEMLYMREWAQSLAWRIARNRFLQSALNQDDPYYHVKRVILNIEEDVLRAERAIFKQKSEESIKKARAFHAGMGKTSRNQD